MDARIGQLVREGKNVYYAYLNGYDNPAFEGTLEQVEVALGLRAAPAVAQKKPQGPLVEYTVHVQKKYPAWNEVNGYDVTVWARSKSEANKIARENDWKEGIFSSMEGPVYYKATRKE